MKNKFIEAVERFAPLIIAILIVVVIGTMLYLQERNKDNMASNKEQVQVLQVGKCEVLIFYLNTTKHLASPNCNLLK